MVALIFFFFLKYFFGPVLSLACAELDTGFFLYAVQTGACATPRWSGMCRREGDYIWEA